MSCGMLDKAGSGAVDCASNALCCVWLLLRVLMVSEDTLPKSGLYVSTLLFLHNRAEVVSHLLSVFPGILQHLTTLCR